MFARPLALALLLTVVCAPPASADPAACTDSIAATVAYSVTAGGEEATGIVSYPPTPPTAILAIGHGWTRGVYVAGGAEPWAKWGAIVVAMDYRGDRFDYKVFTGADDTIAAVDDLQARCGRLPVILWGGSMGGHVSALAIMKRPDLATYLVDDMGPTNIPELVETMQAGFAVRAASRGMTKGDEPFNPTPCPGMSASLPGENECLMGPAAFQVLLQSYGCAPPVVGELYVLDPDCRGRMVASSPALNPEAWSETTLRHAYLLYGAADSIVTVDQGTQFLETLHSNGIAATQYVSVLRGDATQARNDESLHLGAGPADHTSQGAAVVEMLLRGRLYNQEDNVLLGVATPEQDLVADLHDAGVPRTLPPPPPLHPALDGALQSGYDRIQGPWGALDRNYGPFYPMP